MVPTELCKSFHSNSDLTDMLPLGLTIWKSRKQADVQLQTWNKNEGERDILNFASDCYESSFGLILEIITVSD